MGQLTLLLVAFAAVATATLNLGLGFWIGRTTQRKPRRPSDVPRDLRQRAFRRAALELKECLAAAAGLSREAAELSRLVARNEPSLPRELASALGRTLTAVNALERQLTPGLRSLPAPDGDSSAAAPRRRRNHRTEPSSTDSPSSESTKLGFEGQRYNMVQHVAPWTEGVPDASTFTAVHCQKLSTAELVYFAAKAPESERVAVRLRSEETELVLGAQVVEHRMTYFEDRWSCRVHCRFIERLATTEPN
jgi:hypothetical protein